MPSRQPPDPSPAPPPRLAASERLRRLHHHHLLATAAAAAAVVVVLVLVVVVAAAAFFFLRRRRHLAASGDPAMPHLRRLSYSQLRRATSSFSPASKLGQGGFGPVFRGTLPSGERVAVKVMDAAGSLQGEREFHNELSLASHLLSCNSDSNSDANSILLPFAFSLSSPPGRQRRHRQRMMLVYELMPNGSLQDALLGKRCPELVAEWPRRLAVAIDVARALRYVHHSVDPPVVHGDVKPSNVLLDAALGARLADFGLARIKSDDAIFATAEAENGGGDGGCGDDDVSVAGETAAAAEAAKSPEDDEAFTAASPAEAASTSGFDRSSIDSGRDSRSCNGGGGGSGSARKKSVASNSNAGSDWWWRQDNGSNGVKDYVMEWIRSEIKKERPKSDWIAGTTAAAAAAPPPPEKEKKKPKRRAREWWREEFAEELAKKQKRRALAKSRSDAADTCSGGSETAISRRGRRRGGG